MANIEFGIFYSAIKYSNIKSQFKERVATNILAVATAILIQ